jgi:hemolysin D
MQVDGKTIHLTPGMAVTVEIKTGKRRLIEYFLSPLMQYRDESLRER